MVAMQLHSKFWGKSMEEEEQQWRDSQLSEDHRSRTQGGDEDMDPDVDERMDQDANNIAKDGNITEDADDITEIVSVDEDEDIIKGCHVLDIGVRTIKKIWVRAEYIRAYDYFEKHYDAAAKVELEPGAVLTGQPGIGELLASLAFPILMVFGTTRQELLDLLCPTPTPC